MNWAYSLEFQWIIILCTYLGAFIFLRCLKQLRQIEYKSKIQELKIDIQEERKTWI